MRSITEARRCGDGCRKWAAPRGNFGCTINVVGWLRRCEEDSVSTTKPEGENIVMAGVTMIRSLEDRAPRGLSLDKGPAVNLLAATPRGDLVVVSERGLEYGFVTRPGLVPLKTLSEEVRAVGFNRNGDAVYAVGPSYLTVGLLPGRAADGGAAFDGDGLRPWTWQSLPVSGALQASWHAYADDHIGALDSTGLQLWAAGESEPCAVARGKMSAFCWGASSGWARLSALACTSEMLYAACPLAPRRCALPTESARQMRRLCKRKGWVAAEAWLEDVDDDVDLPFVSVSSRGTEVVDFVPVATLASAGAVALANARRDLEGTWALVSVAFEDGRLDFGLVPEASRPRLDDDDEAREVGALAVLDSVMVAPAHATPLFLDEADAATLCYASSCGVALVDAPWLDHFESSLARGTVPESTRATCRHVASAATDTPLVGAVFVPKRPGHDVVVWFADGSAASVNATAARFYAALNDDELVAPLQREDNCLGVLPRLSDEIRSKSSAATAALARLPTAVAGGDRDNLAALLDARATLDADVAVPLADAARVAQALARLLGLAREAQRTQLDKAVAKATRASDRLDDLAELAKACTQRAASLRDRAAALADAAHDLQPRLSKADRTYASTLRTFSDQANRGRLAVQGARARVDRLDATTAAVQPKLELAEDHVRLCNQLLAGQHAILQAANADIAGLHRDLAVHLPPNGASSTTAPA